jgi:hypothetical protein
MMGHRKHMQYVPARMSACLSEGVWEKLCCSHNLPSSNLHSFPVESHRSSHRFSVITSVATVLQGRRGPRRRRLSGKVATETCAPRYDSLLNSSWNEAPCHTMACQTLLDLDTLGEICEQATTLISGRMSRVAWKYATPAMQTSHTEYNPQYNKGRTWLKTFLPSSNELKLYLKLL